MPSRLLHRQSLLTHNLVNERRTVLSARCPAWKSIRSRALRGRNRTGQITTRPGDSCALRGGCVTFIAACSLGVIFLKVHMRFVRCSARDKQNHNFIFTSAFCARLSGTSLMYDRFASSSLQTRMHAFCEHDTGCVDSLMCGYRSTDDVAGMFRECYRVLRPGGVFLCISRESSSFLCFAL